MIPAKHWHHIGTNSNRADHLSRDLTPAELIDCSLWWDGPGIICNNNIDQVFNTSLEEKNTSALICVVQNQKSFMKTQLIPNVQMILRKGDISLLCEKISSWTRLIRIRFIKPQTLELTVTELDNAECIIIRAIQQYEFPDEIR